ncbi:MAG: hypothetical protein N3C12_03865 [Candidatus Binatia bacterium]|nr:hypothetical protein [Candidatus Binatia bacterium]
MPRTSWCAEDAPKGEADWFSALSFANSHAPIVVKADRLEFQYESHLLTYYGNVEVRQADAALSANELHISLAPGKEMQIREVRAIGSVRLSQGNRWATAKEAIFDQANGTAILRGDAILHDGQNEVRGDTVTVFIQERRSVVDGGRGRVQAILYPGGAHPALRREQPAEKP